MNIQIFGTRKCFDTKKAERYFKERRIKYQMIDLKEKDMSKGEFSSVKSVIGINELINTKSKNYARSNLANIRGADVKEEVILKDQSLINTPIVRNGKTATLGYKPEVWESWS